MAAHPLRGDVISLKGKQWKGRYRKRVGQYRIIFTLDHSRNEIEVSAILIRSEKTYG
jgi:mRNA-degrading endonuclease RelE of RelBE toxin-antitoxin system